MARCKKCGFRIRGEHHEDGAHHALGGRIDAKTNRREAVNPKGWRKP